ncbi:ATP-dependent zinc protease family protein [Thiocystis violacea]|uniref:ATP-dependent zinc protease family protein n=1 Tax=Thiocystis violacea TaxID=13725 RepID=UPI0019044682|nr:ATP-dependent zinc protease [Thiocystis violacea]MBK1723693.1 ATP-dependent zinc protease [Thiocystis violacea]
MTEERTETQPCLLGWREWLALPELGLARIKAKVDTGARTSTLHAFYVDTFRRKGQLHARFGVHPIQHRNDIVVHAEAAVIDQRHVRDSGGHREERYIIQTTLALAGQAWPIEVTLTNRESMLFRMLLGRTAIAGNALVDPGRSFVTGRVRRPWDAYCAEPPAVTPC